MESKNKKLSLEPYKGTRDFYPEDQFIQNYIFSVWRKTAESYGYLEYGASILEEAALYKAKSGDEIVNEQTYTFIDRGEREVTIRPEMTPTVARMVAQKRKELSFPLRWYSIPNLFRYERPQRGRLREHWQFNADIFGVDSIDADVEIISLAYDTMKAFGAKDENFEIRINSRKIIRMISKFHGLDEVQEYKFVRLLDKKEKLPAAEFKEKLTQIMGSAEKADRFLEHIDYLDKNKLVAEFKKDPAATELATLLVKLEQKGINNAKYNPTLARGLDYYTGTVFEMYDTNPVNPRALFGGGRYDDLVGIFGVEKVSGIGFGWGDVTTRDFLETYNLLPAYRSTADLYVCHTEGFLEQAEKLSADLRKEGVNVAVDLTDRKISAQVKTADKQKIPFVIVVGEEEVKNGKYKVKSLKQSKETELAADKIPGFIKEN
jgi:histidyl-tRNA synthetase